MIVENVDDQRKQLRSQNKKAKMAITTQRARWHKKYSQRRPLSLYIYTYLELHRSVGPMVQNN
jgi:hypothetical protein